MGCCGRVRDPKRPRELHFVFTVAEDVFGEPDVNVEPDGKLTISHLGKPIPLASAAVEVSYNRRKGRKILTRGVTDHRAPNIDPNRPLLDFAVVVGIDTNTAEIAGETVSVGCVVRVVRERDDSQTKVRPVPFVGVELRNVSGDPEKVMWRLFCEKLMSDPAYRPGLPVAIIVDSSLDAIAEINERRQPVIGDWLLPEGFTLFYASSDATTDTALNRLIARCDRDARAILRRIAERHGASNLLVAPVGAPYSRVCFWHPR